MAARRRIINAPRDAVEKTLKPLLPATWRIAPAVTPADILSTTTVVLKQLAIIPLPVAPKGCHGIEFVVTIWSPKTDPVNAERDLDDSVNVLIHAIDAAGIGWDRATKVSDDNRLGYDIPITISSTKEIGA